MPDYPDLDFPEAHEPGMVFYEQGAKAGQAAPGSVKVGWTLRDTHGQVAAAFAFLINPQGIDRQHGSRSSVQATKSSIYVDHFGPAANQITLRQLVASGKVTTDLAYYTAREDIQRFLKTIWLPATAQDGPSKFRVYFHDHHFERGFEEKVWFPPSSMTIARDVSLHNVWRFELTMVGLEKYPYAEVQATTVDKKVATRSYIVKAGDTLAKLAARLAGPKASSARKAQVQKLIVELNPQLKKPRVVDGKVHKPMKVYPGGKLKLPS